MVANQRTKYQMKDDLSLFLGKNTDEFVDWLYEVLKNIQSNSAISVTSSSERKGKKESSLDDEQSEPKKEKIKKEKKKTKKQIAEEMKMNPVTNAIEVTNTSTLRNKKQGQNEETIGKDIEDHFQQKGNNLVNKNHDAAVCEQAQADQEVFLELKSDIDNDELLLETQEESKPTTEATMPRRNLRRSLQERLKISPKSKGSESGVNPPVSTIGAIFKRNNQQQKVEEDDNKASGKNNVTSVVKVAERKSSVPPAMQASSLLVLKAVQGAHKSVSQTPNQLKRKSSETEPALAYKKSRLNDQSINLKDLDPCDLRHCLEANRAQKDLSNETRYLDNRDSENETSMHQSPRFIVTVGATAKLNKDITSRLGGRVENEAEDELLLDEEIEEEFREDNLDTEDKSEAMTDDNDVPAKINERCKYWPSCKNGTQCLYHHPTSQCR